MRTLLVLVAIWIVASFLFAAAHYRWQRTVPRWPRPRWPRR